MSAKVRHGTRFGVSLAGGKVGYDPALDIGRFSKRANPGTPEAVFRQAAVSAHGRERSRECAAARDEYESREVVLYDGATRALAALKLAMAIFNGNVAPSHEVADHPLVERRALLEVMEKLTAIVHRADCMLGGQ